MGDPWGDQPGVRRKVNPRGGLGRHWLYSVDILSIMDLFEFIFIFNIILKYYLS